MLRWFDESNNLNYIVYIYLLTELTVPVHKTPLDAPDLNIKNFEKVLKALLS